MYPPPFTSPRVSLVLTTFSRHATNTIYKRHCLLELSLCGARTTTNAMVEYRRGGGGSDGGRNIPTTVTSHSSDSLSSSSPIRAIDRFCTTRLMQFLFFHEYRPILGHYTFFFLSFVHAVLPVSDFFYWFWCNWTVSVLETNSHNRSSTGLHPCAPANVRRSQ